MKLPVAQHRQAYAYCAYCPKVCRFACPVSEVTHQETLSTWGKMTQSFLVTTGREGLEPTGAHALYGCTGCMRCRTFCAHQNEVGPALFAARQEALDGGQAPEGAKSTVRTFAAQQNPFGRDLTPLLAQWRAEAPVRFPLFTGCTSLVKHPQVIEDAIAVSSALGASFGVSKQSGRCCGYPLYAAGEQRAFTEHAAQTAEALSATGDLVVLDPGCAYTLKIVYPRMGVKLPVKVRTVYEVLAERLAHAPHRPPLRATVAYHDACHLGRGLGQYEEPRALLRAAVAKVVEAPAAKDEASCSGGGGLLPRTMSEVATKIAARTAEGLCPPEVPVVTACPTSRRMFERGGRRADDLLAVVRRWLVPEAER